MITGQDMSMSFFCPRCGGPMYKPSGSPFYWHATNNHSPCSITNIADVLAVVPMTNDTSSKLPKPKGD